MGEKHLSDYGKNLTFSKQKWNSEELLRELILYIADRCQSDDTFGLVKLNKILYFSDFASYATHGDPITGVEYMRLPQGPVPRRMRPALVALEEARDIVIKTQKVYDYERERVISLRDANLDSFSASDIAIVDDIINRLWNKTADTVSAMSHMLPWRIAAVDKAPIPYEAALLSNEGVTEDDIRRAEELIREHGWDV